MIFNFVFKIFFYIFAVIYKKISFFVMGIKKQIIQFKDDEQIAVFNSATEAAQAIGSTKSNVSKCCCGKLKQVNGFVFKYSGEVTNKKIKQNHGDFKCPYCDESFATYNGLTKHVISFKCHGDGITKEQLLTDFKYGGVRPTCKCGCGGFTDIRYNNGAHFSNYIWGHQSKIHNNWGHNEQAVLKSAETRREQYKNGERDQWNKGKSWHETYTQEEIEKLMLTYKDEKRNEKISNALKDVPKSEEHAEKCRENGRSEKSILINREKMRERLASGKFSISSEIEKEFIDKCIRPLNIDFETQHYLNEIHHYCDVFIPSKNMVIEFQGDYWHGNPKKYKKEDLTSFQLSKIEKDDMLRDFCKNNGLVLIEIWESDYNKDSDKIKNDIENLLV